VAIGFLPRGWPRATAMRWALATRRVGGVCELALVVDHALGLHGIPFALLDQDALEPKRGATHD
jgi:hypothetical protein